MAGVSTVSNLLDEISSRFLTFEAFKEKFSTSENTIIFFVCLPKFCMSIVSRFSWDLQWSQEKTKTMPNQNLR